MQVPLVKMANLVSRDPVVKMVSQEHLVQKESLVWQVRVDAWALLGLQGLRVFLVKVD